MQLQHTEPEIKEVYGTLLDDLNAKHDRLLSLFQQLLATLPDDDPDKAVSHTTLKFNCFDKQCSWSAKLALNYSFAIVI